MGMPFNRQGASFLPQDYVDRKVELRANIICLSLFGVVMFGVVAAFFVTNRQWLTVREQQRLISTQYTQEAKKIEQLKLLEAQKTEMMQKAEITTALLEKVPRSVLLAELVSRMPRDITLLELQLVSKRAKEPPASGAGAGAGQVRSLGGQRPATPAKPGVQTRTGGSKAAHSAPTPQRVAPPKFEYTLKLIGVARTNEDFADYLTNLKGCEILQDVELKTIKPTLIEKVELRRFEIEATIRDDVDARGIEPIRELRQGASADARPPLTHAQDPSKDPGD